jgi:hypothetical protein
MTSKSYSICFNWSNRSLRTKAFCGFFFFLGLMLLLEEMSREAQFVHVELSTIDQLSSVMAQNKWFFLHIHKSAGTEMCHVFKTSPQAFALTWDMYSHNCNNDEFPKNIQESLAIVKKMQREHPDHDVQCVLLDRQYRDLQTNLVSNERYMQHTNDYQPCPGYRYITVLRDPVSRAISHMKFETLSAKVALRWLVYRTVLSCCYREFSHF